MVFIMESLNSNNIPQHWKDAKGILFLKTSSQEASIDKTRPIMVLSHMMKIAEKCIANKLVDTKSKLLQTGDYQSGFKP